MLHINGTSEGFSIICILLLSDRIPLLLAPLSSCPVLRSPLCLQTTLKPPAATHKMTVKYPVTSAVRKTAIQRFAKNQYAKKLNAKNTLKVVAKKHAAKDAKKFTRRRFPA